MVFRNNKNSKHQPLIYVWFAVLAVKAQKLRMTRSRLSSPLNKIMKAKRELSKEEVDEEAQDTRSIILRDSKEGASPPPQMVPVEESVKMTHTLKMEKETDDDDVASSHLIAAPSKLTLKRCKVGCSDGDVSAALQEHKKEEDTETEKPFIPPSKKQQEKTKASASEKGHAHHHHKHSKKKKESSSVPKKSSKDDTTDKETKSSLKKKNKANVLVSPAENPKASSHEHASTSSSSTSDNEIAAETSVKSAEKSYSKAGSNDDRKENKTKPPSSSASKYAKEISKSSCKTKAKKKHKHKKDSKKDADGATSEPQVEKKESDKALEDKIALEALKDQFSLSLARIARLKEDKNLLGHSLTKNSSKLRKVSQESSKLAAKVADLRAILAEKDGFLVNEDEPIEQLEVFLNNEMNSKKELEASLASKDAEIARLNSRMQVLADENASITLELEEKVNDSGELEDLRQQLALSQSDNDKQAYVIEEQRMRIDLLERAYVENVARDQKLEQVVEENIDLKEKLHIKDRDSADMANKAETIFTSIEQDMKTFQEYSDQQAACVLDCLEIESQRYESEISSLNSKLQKSQEIIQKLEEENSDLHVLTKSLHEKLNLAERKVAEADKMEQDLNERISHWASKAYDFKVRAEQAERMGASTCASTHTNTVSEQDEGTIQSQHLQAALDSKASSSIHSPSQQKRKSWPKFVPQIMARNSSDSSDADDEKTPPQNEELLRKYAEQNSILEDQVSRVQSDLVKLQTQFKEESYKNWKKIQQLQSENDAYLLKNAALVKLCGELNFPLQTQNDGASCSKDANPPDFVHLPSSAAH